MALDIIARGLALGAQDGVEEIKGMIGQPNGIASLNDAGKVPTEQLPSYVDDVVEGYYYNNKFYKDEAHTEEIPSEKGKIYVDLATNISYRWSGTTYIAIASNNYNSLDNKPILNIDLNSEGFIPEAGIYYRHTGIGGGPLVGTPFVVGDNVSTMYFDTTSTPDFSAFTISSALVLVNFNDEAELGVVDLGEVVGEEYANEYAIAILDPITVFYSTTAISEMSIQQGWQNLTSGSYSFEDTYSVTGLDSTAGWNGVWASKTAFEPSSQFTTGTIYQCISASPAEYKKIITEADLAIETAERQAADTALQNAINTKQDILIASTNIAIAEDGKTISAPKNPYNYINQISDYLFEVQYSTENIDYDYANAYFKNPAAEDIAGGSCTGIVKNGRVLRHLDWTYDNDAEFLVRTLAEYDDNNNIVKHASVGMGAAVKDLHKYIVESGNYNRKFKMVPFIMTDGINDAGLYIQSNVVTRIDFDINPGATDECCITMVARYILDHCASFADVENFFNTYHIYNTTALKYTYHFLLAQGDQWEVIEITPTGHITVTPGTGTNQMPNGIMTNFRTTGLQFWNGMVNWESVETYGIGVERYDIATKAFTENKSLEDLRSQLLYTITYTGYDSSNPWRTEFTDETAGRTVMDAVNDPSKFTQILSDEHEHYLNRNRDEGSNSIWQTVHSAIYDLANKSLNVAIQERLNTEYIFALNDSEPTKQDKLISGNGINITSNTISTKLRQNGGITFDGDGKMQVTLASGSGINANGRRISVSNGSGLVFDESNNLTYDSNVIQDKLISSQNIKTINEQSLLGSGDIQIKPANPFPSTWPINGTVAQFCQAIQADEKAVFGMNYLGGVAFTDLPSTLNNAECYVQVVNSTVSSSKILHLEIYSATTAPYHWEGVYWNSFTGWHGSLLDVTVDGTSVVNNGVAVLTDIGYTVTFDL